jgi:phage-related protein
LFISGDFIYDGINSKDMGVTIVRVNDGMIESNFGINRNIIEEQIQGRDKPYFYGFKNQPINIPITLALANNNDLLTFEKRQELVKWLFKDDYKIFQTEDNLNICYYVVFEGDSRRFDNSLEQGYINLNLRTDTPFAYLYPNYYKFFDLSANENTVDIVLENNSNVKEYIYPIIEIVSMGSSEFKIKNITTDDNEFIVSNIGTSEIININNDTKRVLSDIPNTYRLSNCNKKWVRLKQGNNTLTITGKCLFAVKCDIPIVI